jgi:predicted unusual protein kinase regulating ubiquinone biosynthesis (AarF/ABC1/UbiB family)
MAKVLQNSIIDFIFLIRTCFIILWEYLMYFLGRPIDNCVKNVSRKLGNINMFYVKAFQSISSNSQLLSREQIEFLSSYTDHVPFGSEDIDIDFRGAIARVNKNKNNNIDNKLIIPPFAMPIKSGMISLIYKGFIGKKKVIIKVARKNIRTRLSNALRQFDLLTRVLVFVFHLQSLGINNIIMENKEMMMLQTNFRNELANIISIREKNKNIDDIVIPRPYKEYTDAYENIIVMDYLEGVTVMQIDTKDRKVYSKQLAQYSLKSILFDRIVHADLHPGNIIFLKDASGKCRSGIIDYGVMLIITKQQQKDFYDFISALFISKDSKKAFAILASSFIEKTVSNNNNNNLEKESLLKKPQIVEKIGHIIENALTTKNMIQPSEIYSINNILYAHGYCLSKAFCKIEMTLAIADSVCRQLTMESNYIDDIKESATKLLTPDICAF